MSQFKITTNNSNEGLFYTGSAERMKITSDGEVLIGTSVTADPPSKFQVLETVANSYAGSFRHSGASSTSYGLAIMCGRNDGNGNNKLINFQDGDGSGVGTIAFSGQTVSYGSTSDARLKNITGKAKGLEIISQLNPIEFTWKKGGQKSIGLIAQEAMEHMPFAIIKDDETGYYQMDYSKFVTPLIKAVQEQQEMIVKLEARISTSEITINTLQQENNTLEQKMANVPTRIIILEAKDTSLETKIIALEVKGTALEEKDTSLENKNTSLEAKDTSLENTINQLLARIITLENIINS